MVTTLSRVCRCAYVQVVLSPATLLQAPTLQSPNDLRMVVGALCHHTGIAHLLSGTGVLNSTVLESFDWLMDQAEERGLQFQMTLTNSWPDYGGMRQYVR